MRNNLLLLLGVVLLYLIPSLILNATYGPSYGFLKGEDRWIPDSSGGWVKHGNPAEPAPSEPSVNVPLWANYLPIFLPGLLLALFLFTPLTRKLETKKPTPPETEPSPPPDSNT